MQEHRGEIIVVEDDHSVNRAIARLLEAAGFRASTFGSAEELLIAEAAQQRAKCFVFDVHLPGMSGIELYAKLRDAGISAPLVIITAHDDPVYRQAATQIGAAAYIRKPFSSRALIAAVASAMLADGTRAR